MIIYQVLSAVLAIALLFVLFLYFTLRKQLAEHDSQSKLINKAYFDELTTFPNEEGIAIIIEDQMARCERHSKPFFTAVIKIDNTCDDAVLEAADRLYSSIRQEDTVAYLSKGRFVVVFNEYLDEPNSNTIFDRIKKSLRKEYTIDNLPEKVPFSVNINTYPKKNTTDALIHFA